MIKFVLFEFNEKQNAPHYNIFDEKTFTFRDVPNTNNWKPICIFNTNSRKESKIINKAIKLMTKAKENKIECGKEHIESNIMGFSKDSIYWDNLVMRKIRTKEEGVK